MIVHFTGRLAGIQATQWPQRYLILNKRPQCGNIGEIKPAMATLGGTARVPTLFIEALSPLWHHFLIGLMYFAGKSFGTETFNREGFADCQRRRKVSRDDMYVTCVLFISTASHLHVPQYCMRRGHSQRSL